MSLYELPSSNISILSDKDQDEISISSYCQNRYDFFSKMFFVNNDEFNFDDTNDISQGILTMNENQLEIYKKVFNLVFDIKNDNKINDSFNSLDNIEEKIKNSLDPHSMNKVEVSNIIIEINNTNFNDADINENQNNIFKIFNNGNYDNFSNNIIDEALNSANKKCKKIKKIKNIFTLIPKKPKKKKKKNIEHRKDNADNIRKKIKVKFHKLLKNAINEKLKNAGSKYIFKALPQSFITSVTKKYNKPILDLSLKKIFSLHFNVKENENQKHNLKVLEYLDRHHDICEKSNFNKIKNMKIEEVFNEYLLSKEFKLAISTLKKEKENDQYIKKYIIKAHNFISFLKFNKKKK